MKKLPWYDASKSFAERIELLLCAMTSKEKISQMLHESPEIKRLGIPAYNWWNEALHGVGRAGLATVFPQSIGLAATFDDKLALSVADVISTEARAKYHAASANGYRSIYMGLTFWTPNINIFRDPRWGRGQETYGEDPYLTAQMGTAFVKGLQGNDPKYLKTAACAKHFLVHSGPESQRHAFNAKVNARDFYTTYAPAFKALVQDAKVESVMGAYNRTNGEVCCGSKKYITKLLREQWKFKGHFVSDCWAIRDFHEYHQVTSDMTQSAALAVRNGCDLNCGCSFEKLVDALKRNLITEAEIDNALRRLLMTRMKLGMFDPDQIVPYAQTSLDQVHTPEHRALAQKAAAESIVLLKNDGILPLPRKINSIGIDGPNADSIKALVGNYNGWSDNFTTLIEGMLAKLGSGVMVDIGHGSRNLADPHMDAWGAINCHWTKIKAVILALGLDSRYEGEQGDAGDNESLELPAGQIELVDYYVKHKVPVIAVVMAGSPINLSPIVKKASAILYVWYPGEAGGAAIADVITGDYNPAGRLPVTFPMSVKDLPDFTDYNMTGRTYRYMDKKVLYKFGYGLSYTTFAYTDQRLVKPELKKGEKATIEVTLTNTGKVAGDEVAQLYLRHINSPEQIFHQTLAGFKRVHLKPGASKKLKFTITPEQLCVCNDKGEFYQYDGLIELAVSGGQMEKSTPKLKLKIKD